MFSKIIAALPLAFALFASVLSTSIHVSRVLADALSFNNWGGISSLNGFDDFFGVGNFNGHYNGQTIIERDVQVCHVQRIEIVQQRLFVLQELSKRVINELICDVETQVIVFEQFHNNYDHFRDDLRRNNARFPAYDRAVAGHYGRLFDSSGNLTSDDLGFKGSDIGSNSVVFGGTNWDAKKSPVSIMNAYNAAVNASYFYQAQ